MKNTVKFWNKTSGNYDTSVYLKYIKVYQETISLTEKYLKPEDDVLDFACGTGFFAIELAGNVNSILAIDISDKMIEEAKRKSNLKQIKNVKFENKDIFDHELCPGSFTVILAFNIFQFIKEEDVVITRISELLMPNGLFISATDCYNEKMSGIVILMKILSKLNFLPFVKSITIKQLEDSITRNKFEVLERKILYDKPVNCFIAARLCKSAG